MSDSTAVIDTKQQKEAENKAKSLILSKKIRKEDKYFNEEWLKKLVSTIDNVRDLTYIKYHVETGLRVTDVINTEVIHIEWENNRTNTYDHKKDEWRFVYFPESVKTQLKMWMKQRQIEGIKDKLLFNFTEKTANRIVKHWAKVIEFPYASLVSSHWLRHTFIRLSRQAGRDIVAVRQNTGDTYKTILEWYSGLNSDDMKKEIERKPLIDY